MDSAEHSVGGNVTIYQGSIYHHSLDKESDRCLADLRLTDPRDDKTRIEQTKGGLLKESYDWILENETFKQWYNDDQGQLLWITGDPGKGKTMLICGIINELSNKAKRKDMKSDSLLSYFFCQGTDSRINTATAALRGLLYLIIDQQPSLISHVRSKYDITGKGLFDNPNAWTVLSQIFTSVLHDTSIENAILIIDAIDECVTDQIKLLDFIIHQSLPRIKWIVTGRNDLKINERLSACRPQTLLCIELREHENCISKAVDAYIKYSISQLDLLQNDQALQNDLRKLMQREADRTFLWVSLVLKELAHEHMESRKALQIINEMPSDLKDVYARMMEQILRLDQENSIYCRQLLSTVCAAYRPLSLSELGLLSDSPQEILEKPEAIRRIVTMCGSFLTIRGENVYLVHQSAKDYLSTEALQTICPNGQEQTHHSLFTRSLHGMYKTLQRDIYNFNAPGILITEAMLPDPDPLAMIRYSCIHWIDHLYDGISYKTSIQISDFDDDGIIHQFFGKMYLYWLEALSWLGSTSYGIAAVNKLEVLLPGRLIEFLRDARRFILVYRKVIEIAPLQLYASALLFSPTNSLVRHLFQEEEPKWIASKPLIDANWGTCLQTLERHEEPTINVVYSADWQRLASGLLDNTIKIWDSITGACLLTLEGHHKTVRSVVFSADDQRILSASKDGTVKIWDATLGSCIQTFKCGHEGSLVILSSDGRLAASILRNGDICIWDLEDATSHVLGIPSRPTSCPTSIVLSADSQLLAVVYEGGVVNIWEIATEKCRQTLQSSGAAWYKLAAFSPNGWQFASSGNRTEVKIWSIETGQCVRVLEGHGEEVASAAFSQDSLRIASGFQDGRVDIWDISTGNCLQTIHSPCDWATSVVFSRNDQELAISGKITVIWDLDIAHTSQRTETRDSRVDHIIFSKDSRRIASLSYRCAKIWNSSDSICSQTFHTRHTFVDSQMFSRNGQWLALGKMDHTIEIMSMDVEKSVQILSGHDEVVKAIAFAPDSRHLVTVGDNMAKVWEPMTGKCLQTIYDVADWLEVSFSPDSQKIATATTAHSPRLVKIWDVEKRECSLTLSIFEVELILSLIFFSPDCKLLGTAMLDRRHGISEVKIWDTVEGACLQSFKDIEGRVKVGAFSSDNQLLASYSEGRRREGRRRDGRYLRKVYNTIKIWDRATGASLITLDARPQIDRLSFDPFTSSRIHTNLGILNLNIGSFNMLANASSQEVIHHGYGISLDGMWIVNGKERLLWLPPDYRTRASAVFESQIAMGTISRESNSLLLMRFPIESHEHM
ncbi:hypothetical protein ACHAQJ_001219 [Trichoderma viride]